MKKLLIITVIFATFLGIRADASTVAIDYQGTETTVLQDGMERKLIINSDDDTLYDIDIRPLEESMTSADGKYVIPLANVFINNTTEDVYMEYGRYSKIFQSITMGGVAKNIVAKVREYGMVPAGTYNLNLEVQATDLDAGSVVSTTVFNLQFIVPVSQEVDFNGETPLIVVGTEDAFEKNKKITNQNPSIVYINSNTDWELSVNTNNLGETVANYYIRTIGASSNVTERLQERVLLQPDKEIIIAKGTAPSNKEYVTVEFSLENTENDGIKAGSYENKIKYVLREIIE